VFVGRAGGCHRGPRGEELIMDETARVPTLNHLFFRVLDRGEKARLLQWRDASGQIVEYSTWDFSRSVFAVYRYLKSCGLMAGDRVAIFSENRPEWHIVDFAVQLAGMIVVPIYPTLSSSQTQFLLDHSGCRAVFTSGRDRLELLRAKLPELSELRWVVSMDDLADGLLSLPALVAQAAGAGFSGQERQTCLSVRPDNVATIVYTSGTTARPKGVMLSHANLTFDLDRCLARLAFRTTEQALSVLPLAHVFERMLCYGYLSMDVAIAYGNPYDLKQLLALYHPQVMGCVPRMLEKIHETIHGVLSSLPAPICRTIRSLMDTMIEDARSGYKENPLRSRNSLVSRLAERIIVRRLHHRLGGIQYLVCGGAWLNPEIELFFRAVRFRVLQGYGMTETSPVITLNALGAERLGSVGHPLDGVEVSVSESGEIHTRGGHVMLGYYKDPGTTAAVLRNGWLATGDLGRIDEDGYLFVTGRAKETIVLSNGKKVYCPALEQAIERSRYIRKAFLVGHGRRFVAALIIPHAENVERAASEFGMPVSSLGNLLAMPCIAALMERDVHAQQSDWSQFEQVKKFSFITEEELANPDLVTPTQKVRRDRLEVRFARQIERMYVEEATAFATASGAPQQVT